jgi:hypothetical protein
LPKLFGHPFYLILTNYYKSIKTKKENEFWVPANSSLMKQSKDTRCKICQCTEGKLSCYLNSCENLKYPTKAHIFVNYNEKKEINARTIPFFADIIKTMKKDSTIFVVSGKSL